MAFRPSCSIPKVSASVTDTGAWQQVPYKRVAAPSDSAVYSRASVTTPVASGGWRPQAIRTADKAAAPKVFENEFPSLGAGRKSPPAAAATATTAATTPTTTASKPLTFADRMRIRVAEEEAERVRLAEEEARKAEEEHRNFIGGVVPMHSILQKSASRQFRYGDYAEDAYSYDSDSDHSYRIHDPNPAWEHEDDHDNDW